MTLQEVSAILTPAIVALLVAVVGVAIQWMRSREAWLKVKTEEWERMTQRAVDASEGAQTIAAESKDVVDELARQSIGTNAKLVDRNTKTTFAAGMMKAELNRIAREHGTVNIDDLDRIEEEFIKNVNQNAGK